MAFSSHSTFFVMPPLGMCIHAKTHHNSRETTSFSNTWYRLYRLYLSPMWDYFLRNMAAPPKHSKKYGRPVAGSKTEARGKYAGAHISQEVKALCNVILQMGDEQPGGTVAVTFRRLFERYTSISNKVVGMLLRAQKQNLVDFWARVTQAHCLRHVRVS